MQRKKVPAGHHRFGLAGCLFQPVLTARGTLLFLPGA